MPKPLPVPLPPGARAVLAAAALALGLAAAGDARAADEREVKMLNQGEAGTFVFEPAVLTIAPGDTVHFIAVDMGHNAESIDGMTPEGGPTWKGALNKDVSVALDAEGVYGYRCMPHYGLGMVGLIVVGDPAVNLEAAQQVRLTGRAKDRMEELLAQIR